MTDVCVAFSPLLSSIIVLSFHSFPFAPPFESRFSDLLTFCTSLGNAFLLHRNFATIFGPNLFRCPADPPASSTAPPANDRDISHVPRQFVNSGFERQFVLSLLRYLVPSEFDDLVGILFVDESCWKESKLTSHPSFSSSFASCCSRTIRTRRSSDRLSRRPLSFSGNLARALCLYFHTQILIPPSYTRPSIFMPHWLPSPLLNRRSRRADYL
jgi:hypothetical protein